MAVAIASATLSPERTVSRATRLLSEHVTPSGYDLEVNWKPVPGATKAEVDSASVEISPDAVDEPLGKLPIGKSGSFVRVTVPGGKRIRSLTLSGVKSNKADVPKDLMVDGQQMRLVVVVPGNVNGWSPPLYAVPTLPARGPLLPPELAGASYKNGLLGPLNIAAPQIGIGLVQNDSPEGFAPVDLDIDSVSAIASTLPKNMQLASSDGAVLWSFPGEFALRAPIAEVDLRTPIEKALNAALAKNSPPATTFKLTSAVKANAFVIFSGATGALVLPYPGVLKTKVEGDPAPVPLPALLPQETPTSATADLTVRYQGIRILETISDPVPSDGGAAGLVVTDQPVTQAFPPAALDELKLAKVGVIGRAPEDCELSVRLVDMAAGTPGQALFSPGVVQLKAANAMGTVWIDLPKDAKTKGPVGLSVRANKGRFFWASGSRLLSRIALYDPDPGGRPLRLGGSTLLEVKNKDTHVKGAALPPGAFTAAAPAFESNLFLAVDLSDLTLRYRR